MNYTELKTAVEDAVENSFSATDFATMTKLAEQLRSYQKPKRALMQKLTLMMVSCVLFQLGT